MKVNKSDQLSDRGVTPPACGPSEAPLVLAGFLPYRISVVAERVSRAFADRYEKEFNLSIPEWRVMAVLGERAPRTTQKVIEQTEMDRVRVSRAVIRLADKGLVSRQVHPADQRAQILRLTRRGREIYRRIVPLARRMHAELAAALTPEDLRALDQILPKLYEAAGALLRRTRAPTAAPSRRKPRPPGSQPVHAL